MKTVVLSAGPIPAKLDSVKFITNKFKGGLAVKTAEELSLHNDIQVTIVKWRETAIRFHHPESHARITVTDVDDIYDYRDCILNTPADAYVLAAAVANLAPASPWKGKFPSHHYSVGEEFDIRFTIAPRIIDEVKKNFPRSSLIGYKLFDGTESELLLAGWETLCGSRANVIFCNHPATAKQEKIALMPDGTHIRLSFEQHIDFIKRVISLQWYTTELSQERYSNKWQEQMDVILADIAIRKDPYVFGTVAVRDDEGFITTTRGKRGPSKYCKVFGVDHKLRVVKASRKATMNAPFIDKLLGLHPQCNWALHAHCQLTGVRTYPYSFSGTMEETDVAATLYPSDVIFNVDHHGYYALFESLSDVMGWLHADRAKNA